MSGFDRQINGDGDSVADGISEAMRDQRDALGRIADTLDDFMEMTLSVQKLTYLNNDPDVKAALEPLYNVLARIQRERDERRR